MQREADSLSIGGTMMLRAATLGLRAVRTGAGAVLLLDWLDFTRHSPSRCALGPSSQQEAASGSSHFEGTGGQTGTVDAWLAAQQDNRPQAAAPQTDAIALGTQHLFGNALLRDLERERQKRRQADRQAQALQQQQPEIPIEDDHSVMDLCSLSDGGGSVVSITAAATPDGDTYVERPPDLDSDDDNVPVGLAPAPLTQGGKHDVTAPFFGTVNAFAAVVAADRLGVLEPGLDASEEQLEENCRRVEAEMVADTERKLPAYFNNLAGNDVVGAARDLREETLKRVKEKQTHWTVRGKLGQLSEQMMGSYRRLLDALHEGARRSNIERVANGSHHFLGPDLQNRKVANGTHNFQAGNRKRERGPAVGGTSGTPWDQYTNCKNRIRYRIEAGDALSPLQKALAEQFKKDDPDYIYGTAPSGPVELVVDTKKIVESDAPIRVMETNTVQNGTRVITNRRYEETKGATTAKQFIDAGFNRTDLAYDVTKGFVKVLGEIPKRRKQDHKNRGLTEEQKHAMSTRYLKILEEHQS